jgi:hypothetical protein
VQEEPSIVFKHPGHLLERLPLIPTVGMLPGREVDVGVAALGASGASPVAIVCISLYVSSFDDTFSPIFNTLDNCDRQLTTSLCFMMASRAFSFAIIVLS